MISRDFTENVHQKQKRTRYKNNKNFKKMYVFGCFPLLCNGLLKDVMPD